MQADDEYNNDNYDDKDAVEASLNSLNTCLISLFHLRLLFQVLAVCLFVCGKKSSHKTSMPSVTQPHSIMCEIGVHVVLGASCEATVVSLSRT